MMARYSSSILSILLGLAVLSSALSEDDSARKFADFMKTYHKVYDSVEEFNHRYAIFKSNLVISEKLQQENPQAIFGVTKFSDLSPEEFKSFYLLSNFTSSKASDKKLLPQPEIHERDLPISFNWVSEGKTTPIKNQWQCGSCWAISVTENVESMWAIAGNTLRNLSEQQLIDCSWSYGNNGCNGGDPVDTYPYIINVHGQEGEKDYPYTAKDGTCKFDSAKIKAKISSWGYVVTHYDDVAMKKWIYANGPPSVCVDALAWANYHGGIIGSNCGIKIDHCVQLVGWDFVQNTRVWIVRNSWGSDWGMGGYIYISRDGNNCAIGDQVTSSYI